MASALYISHRVRSCCHDNHIQALPSAPYTPTPRHHPSLGPATPRPLDHHRNRRTVPADRTGTFRIPRSTGPGDREVPAQPPAPPPGETLYIEDRDGNAAGNPPGDSHPRRPAAASSTCKPCFCPGVRGLGLCSDHSKPRVVGGPSLRPEEPVYKDKFPPRDSMLLYTLYSPSA
ncbi:unnamed protein product [Gadus morhua 'NCC']